MSSKVELTSAKEAIQSFQNPASPRKVLCLLHSILTLYLAALFPPTFPALRHWYDIKNLSLGAEAHKFGGGRPYHGET